MTLRRGADTRTTISTHDQNGNLVRVNVSAFESEAATERGEAIAGAYWTTAFTVTAFTVAGRRRSVGSERNVNDQQVRCGQR